MLMLPNSYIFLTIFFLLQLHSNSENIVQRTATMIKQILTGQKKRESGGTSQSRLHNKVAERLMFSLTETNLKIENRILSMTQ